MGLIFIFAAMSYHAFGVRAQPISRASVNYNSTPAISDLSNKKLSTVTIRHLSASFP